MPNQLWYKLTSAGGLVSAFGCMCFIEVALWIFFRRVITSHIPIMWRLLLFVILSFAVRMSPLYYGNNEIHIHSNSQ